MTKPEIIFYPEVFAIDPLNDVDRPNFGLYSTCFDLVVPGFKFWENYPKPWGSHIVIKMCERLWMEESACLKKLSFWDENFNKVTPQISIVGPSNILRRMYKDTNLPSGITTKRQKLYHEHKLSDDWYKYLEDLSDNGYGESIVPDIIERVNDEFFSSHYEYEENIIIIHSDIVENEIKKEIIPCSSGIALIPRFMYGSDN